MDVTGSSIARVCRKYTNPTESGRSGQRRLYTEIKWAVHEHRRVGGTAAGMSMQIQTAQTNPPTTRLPRSAVACQRVRWSCVDRSAN